MSFDGSNGVPDPSMICLYPEILKAAAQAEQAASACSGQTEGESGPDPSTISLYPEMLRSATVKETAEQTGLSDQYEDGSGPPDPSMVCLYPEIIRAAQGGKGS